MLWNQNVTTIRTELGGHKGEISLSHTDKKFSIVLDRKNFYPIVNNTGEKSS